jgi:oligopeptide/dipeptide ABC transporter ATP-binding protein
MYAGQVVESAPTRELFDDPAHPYTHGLFDCLPSEHIGERLRPIPGFVPPAGQMPAGCRFHPRCPHAQPGRCDTDAVVLGPAGPGRLARCVRIGELVREEAASPLVTDGAVR